MGEWHEAEYAWLIPTVDGRVMADDPAAPGTKPIYKVAVANVPEFLKKNNRFGIEFVPLYSDVIRLD